MPQRAISHNTRRAVGLVRVNGLIKSSQRHLLFINTIYVYTHAYVCVNVRNSAIYTLGGNGVLCVCVYSSAVCDNIYVLCIRIFYRSVYGGKEWRGAMTEKRETKKSKRLSVVYVYLYVHIIYESYLFTSAVYACACIRFGGSRIYTQRMYTSSDFYPQRFVSRVSHNNSAYANALCTSCCVAEYKIYYIYRYLSVYIYLQARFYNILLFTLLRLNIVF